MEGERTDSKRWINVRFIDPSMATTLAPGAKGCGVSWVGIFVDVMENERNLGAGNESTTGTS